MQTGVPKRKRCNEAGDGHGSRYSSRRRVACQSCRVRKVKCDQARPTCGLCQSSGNECVFLDNSDDPPKLDPATRFISDRLDEVLAGVRNIETRLQNPGQIEGEAETEDLKDTTKDYLKIPWGGGSADTVLTWPIFKQEFRPDTFIGCFFREPTAQPSNGVFGISAGSETEPTSKDCYHVPGGFHTLPDDRIPALVDRFLQNVHTKNPILDVDALVHAGRRAVTEGLGWDAESCLVLLACALGSVSYPFVKALSSGQDFGSPVSAKAEKAGSQASSVSKFASDLRIGESYFILACRRLGLLKFTVLGAQCHFFSGVYLMYTFRPLEAWNHFNQASTFFQFFLKSVGGPHNEQNLTHDSERLQQISRLQRRLEQSLYWSCFKSEVEMRVELPLVQSTISSFEYPDLFPSPPTPTNGDATTPGITMPSSLRQAVDATYSSSIRDLRSDDSSSPLTDDMQELQQHRRALYNEEESWYYYLTEVALRRIGNRIINTFFRRPRDSWLRIAQWIPIALEFDDQISRWSANLPASMQTFETSSTAGRSAATSPANASDVWATGSTLSEISVAKEMSWCIENRLLEMRSWLYQPFLYYAIHYRQTVPSNGASNGGLRPDQEAALNSLIQAGIDCNIKILEWRSLPHRHHGIWFDLRAVVTAVIILNAVARSTTLDLPTRLFAEGIEGFDEVESDAPRITFAVAFERLRFWEDETPDIRNALVILKKLVADTKSIRHMRDCNA